MITLSELENVINYILDNNKELVKRGLPKTTINVEGEAGLGKTEVIMQIAERRGMKCTKVNLAQCEELGDILGIPVKQYLMYSPDGNSELWVPDKMVDHMVNLGYKVCDTCESKMGYSIPHWVPQDDSEAILLIDDYTRGNQRFIQAIMELISRGEYLSWKLPDNCQIIMTSNPDSGDYNLQSTIDNAQRTRFIQFEVEFDARVWAKWAEEAGIDSRCINFVLLYPELFKKKNNQVSVINARSLVMFFNSLASLADFSSMESMAMINLLSKGCFPDQDNIVGNLFVLFINNKLDKLISPHDMLTRSWDYVEEKLKDCIYDGDNYKASISSTLTLRLINYIEVFLSKEDNDTTKDKFELVCKRIEELCLEEGKVLLTEDLIFNLIKKLNAKYKRKFTKLLINPEIRDKILN